MVSLEKFRFDGDKKLELDTLPTSAKGLGLDKDKIRDKTEANRKEIAALQDKLYAEGKESLILILQAMDAAGKDSTIKHVMSSVDPQGLDVHSMKDPTSEELSHDFLWRTVIHLPPRGKMAIFNRSYYEDVLIVKVHQLQKVYEMADRCLDDKEFFEKRYRQIRHFEEYLYENSYRVLKIFLNISKEEQKKRFLERIDIPAKNWKFSDSDVRERAYWNDYMDAYQKAVNETASAHSPWYVLPADNKWYTRYLVSEAILDTLKEIDPHYPKLPEGKQGELKLCREKLLAEEEKER